MTPPLDGTVASTLQKYTWDEKYCCSHLWKLQSAPGGCHVQPGHTVLRAPQSLELTSSRQARHLTNNHKIKYVFSHEKVRSQKGEEPWERKRIKGSWSKEGLSDNGAHRLKSQWGAGVTQMNSISGRRRSMWERRRAGVKCREQEEDGSGPGGAH